MNVLELPALELPPTGPNRRRVSVMASWPEDETGAGQSPVGLQGVMVTASRGDEGPGEVEVQIRGGSEVFIARSAHPIGRGVSVLCVQSLGPRTVYVAPWDEADWAEPAQ
jgi:hypothetical protein